MYGPSWPVHLAGKGSRGTPTRTPPMARPPRRSRESNALQQQGLSRSPGRLRSQRLAKVSPGSPPPHPALTLPVAPPCSPPSPKRASGWTISSRAGQHHSMRSLSAKAMSSVTSVASFHSPSCRRASSKPSQTAAPLLTSRLPRSPARSRIAGPTRKTNSASSERFVALKIENIKSRPAVGCPYTEPAALPPPRIALRSTSHAGSEPAGSHCREAQRRNPDQDTFDGVAAEEEPRAAHLPISSSPCLPARSCTAGLRRNITSVSPDAGRLRSIGFDQAAPLGRLLHERVEGIGPSCRRRGLFFVTGA